ncbi:hypothetical protein [Candidatus Halocynthiibacter alkanivorans]|uniref:hypothetical protein n=1 Tax=Candidatus Halocynthiibacter alkanivorans TaxID=2267619 RepID=UPI00109D4479|nr:hypothetical protein [Candidatus Halocynthiibacter alkanivorans]
MRCLVPSFSVLMAALAAGTALAGSNDDPWQKNVTLLAIPSATVAPSGLVFTSLSAPTNGDNASAAIGVGFGDATDGIGLQLTSVVSAPANGLDSSGYFSLRGSARIGQGATPVYLGIGADHIGIWGDTPDRDVGLTAMLTAFPVLTAANSGNRYPMMVTLGGGTHVRNGDTDPGLFLGAGIGLSESIGVSAAWSGDSFDIGASFRPANIDNMRISAVVTDAFDSDDNQRLTLSFSWFFNNMFGG